MRNLKIGNDEYKIEFSIEASLYKDCTEKVTNLMTDAAMAGTSENIKGIISAMADIPQTTLHMFHAGLLEHHNFSISTSKELLSKYLKENKENDSGNFYAIMNMLLEDMDNDGFFGLIGLDKIFAQTEENIKKQPQDHLKKKRGKVTAN